MRVSEWMKTAIQNSDNQSVPLCSLYENEHREQTTAPQTRIKTGLIEPVPFVPCVPLENRYSQEKTQNAANDAGLFPLELMQVLDRHYRYYEIAGDYQDVWHDIHHRPEMFDWCIKEANRLLAEWAKYAKVRSAMTGITSHVTSAEVRNLNKPSPH